MWEEGWKYFKTKNQEEGLLLATREYKHKTTKKKLGKFFQV